jgi:uncharacterized lipoprotein YddW (UPF0748 family)
MANRWQRWAWIGIGIALAVGLVGLSGRSPAVGDRALAASSFSDLGGHWAQPCIQALNERRIVNGYPDGRFQPEGSVTRAEFVALMVTAWSDQLPPSAPPIAFSDVPPGFWAAAAIRQATQAGAVAGYPDRTFRPASPVTRAQLFTALASGLKWGVTGSVAERLAGFADRAEIPNYAQAAIAAAAERQAVVNYPQRQQLRPNANATRAEVAAALCQALPKLEGLVPTKYVAGSGNSATREIRGVWMTNIDSDVLFDPKRLDQAIQTLAQNNFNTVYPAVWNWGYTLYPSAVMQREIGLAIDPRPPGLRGRDPLQEMITASRRQKLAVIPWFEFGLMAPADSELARRHPDWLTQTQSGQTIWLEGKDERVWLNPLNPQVQQFMLDLVQEIVAKYDVDGIQFDDHFGLPVAFGYDPLTVERYRQEYDGAEPPPLATDPDWVRWRADKITAFMAQVFRTIKAAKPNAIVSLAPNPYAFAYNQSLQDWKRWEQQGLIEELLVQIYRNDLSRFTEELNQPELQAARRHIPTGVGILSGLAGRRVPIGQIREQVQAVRAAGYGGVSFFFYETLWNLTTEPSAVRQAAFKALFTPPVPRSTLGEPGLR